MHPTHQHGFTVMKRPVVFVALGMLLAFVMMAGVVMLASNALAGVRLRETGNGDIDVNIALSQPTPALPVGGNASSEGDAIRQRELEYEEKLREMVRMAQTAAPALIDPTEAPTALPTRTVMPAVSRPTQTAISPASTQSALPTEQPRVEDKRGPSPSNTPKPEDALVPAATDDHGGDRKTPEPADQQTPAQPAPTDDGSNREEQDNSGPSATNTPKPDDQRDDQRDDRRDDQQDDKRDDSSNSGSDRPPKPPKDD